MAIGQAVNLFEAGWNAYRLGCNSFDCPFKPGDPRGAEWISGYASAKKQRIKPFEVERAKEHAKVRPPLVKPDSTQRAKVLSTLLMLGANCSPRAR